jgi:hypothetical protein
MLRSAASAVVRGRVSGLSIDALKERAAANAELYNLGITFTIYFDAKTIDRILPFGRKPMSSKRSGKARSIMWRFSTT